MPSARSTMSSRGGPSAASRTTIRVAAGSASSLTASGSHAADVLLLGVARAHTAIRVLVFQLLLLRSERCRFSVGRIVGCIHRRLVELVRARLVHLGIIDLVLVAAAACGEANN